MKINVSVRNMVEFVYRSGDIDSGYMSSLRAQDGIRIHKKIQATRKRQAQLNGGLYEAEVSLKYSFSYKEHEFTVDGRADGIMIKDSVITVEEIKSTTMDISLIESNPEHWHLAQAKCYGYIYCVNNNISTINIGLTYCNVESEEHETFEYAFSDEELKTFFYDTIERYYVFAHMDYQRIERRNNTVKDFKFPFGSYRKGQRELAVSVYAAINKSKRLFAHAPTGIGKTVSTLYPAIKSLERGLITKIFYLTSRTTNALAALDCLRLMEDKGLDMVSLTITAKGKLCILDEPSCNPSSCEYAKGHFDRVNGAIIDIVTNERIIERKTVEAYASKHRVCPYEMSLDASLFCDVVVGDYNYAYDPTAKLKRYFSEGLKNDFALLVDEAHNLVDRAREMYSGQISTAEMNIVSSLFRNKKSGFKNAANKIKKLIRKLDKSSEENDNENEGNATVLEKLSEQFFYTLNDFTAEADKWLAVNEGTAGFNEIMDIYFNVLDFLKIQEYYDECYKTVIYKKGKDITVKLMCIDPSNRLSLCNQTARSTVYFSATLNHMGFFMDTLGGKPDDYKILLSSPFKRENLGLMVNSAISTKYRDREATYSKIADLTGHVINARKGNYLVFFSSYVYMEKVFEIFNEAYPRIKAVCQARGDKTNEFIDNFNGEKSEAFAGFAVLGAGYSEGIDLTGDKLIGAVVVGVGLPMISFERDITRDYYERKLNLGYEYAYIYPGINKVLQAAGRVIRKEDDKGIVLLIDTRYSERIYEELFPPEWYGYETAQKPENVSRFLKNFWEDKQ